MNERKVRELAPGSCSATQAVVVGMAKKERFKVKTSFSEALHQVLKGHAGKAL